MIAKPSRTRKTKLQGRALDQYRRYINWWINTLFVVLIVLPLTVMAIYCANLPNGGLTAFGAAVMMAAASTLAGGLLGFLFGIPRALSSDAESGSNEATSRLIPNTNLEQVSDWLTKIIVGATLVQLGSLPHRFAELATSVSGIFGSPSTQNKVMAGAIILYSALFGFFGAYIAARSIITFLFYLSPADVIAGQLDMQAERKPNGDEGSQVQHATSTGPDNP
jgi:hypothetical protein